MPPGIRVATSLLESVSRDQALVDGNERLALGATIAFSGVTGSRLTFGNDVACALTADAASGTVDDVATIAERRASDAVARA